MRGCASGIPNGEAVDTGRPRNDSARGRRRDRLETPKVGEEIDFFTTGWLTCSNLKVYMCCESISKISYYFHKTVTYLWHNYIRCLVQNQYRWQNQQCADLIKNHKHKILMKHTCQGWLLILLHCFFVKNYTAIFVCTASLNLGLWSHGVCEQS